MKKDIFKIRIILLLLMLLLVSCGPSIDIKPDDIGKMSITSFDLEANQRGYWRWHYEEYYGYQLVGWNKFGAMPYYAVFDERGNLVQYLDNNVVHVGGDIHKIKLDKIPSLKMRKDEVLKKKAEADRVAAEKSSAVLRAKSDRITAKRAKSDRIAAEKARADRIAAEKARADRIAAEKSIAVERAVLEDKVSQKAIKKGYIYIIGLVPDISTREQVERAKSDLGFIIGGYRLICTPDFIDEKLASLVCITGKDSGSIDIIDDRNIDVSNIDVHNTLVLGFTEKFGKPKTTKIPTRTGFGVEYISELSVWHDKFGNELSLVSMTTNINTGALFLKSYKKIDSDKRMERKVFESRSF